MEILIIKVAALGDVVRTTSILPGLLERYPGARVTWLTGPGARDLVRYHPAVDRVVAVEPDDLRALRVVSADLAATEWTRVLSLDDEEPLCRLAAAVAGPDARDSGVLSGAFYDENGVCAYTDDVAPWFDMGLLSRFGLEEADRLKVANTESHASIFARMLAIEMGEPELPLPDSALAFAKEFAEEKELARNGGPVIGLNTGASGRWRSKRLPVKRVIELMEELTRRLEKPTFVLLGGPNEAARNASIRRSAGDRFRLVDSDTNNAVLDFAALIDRLDLLVASDSLALHIAVARRIPVVAFFAPTSAAEIELYGRGRKVVSTAPDACSYRTDADTSTLTAARIADAVEELL